jgi:antitoxin component YwqK of YwqJK toxin-antitoxin module
MNRHMKITRDISSGSDKFVSLEIDDSDLTRHVAIMFNDPSEAKKIHLISESANNKKDGLNASQSSLGESYSYWEEGREMFSRNYNTDGIRVYFKQYEYENGKVYEDLWTYYDDGLSKSEQHLVDGKYESPYIQYAEFGNIKTKANYVNGMKDGEYAEYHDSGRLWRARTYIEDKLYGDYKKFYDNEANLLSASGYYVNG